MNSILLSKYLYKKALDCYSPNEPFSYGLTISLLQDSAEMLVWEMAKFYNIQSRSKDGFVRIIEIIDENHKAIELKQQIFELNQARVSFKHYGNLPLNKEVSKFIQYCSSFLERNSLNIGVDFANLSIVDTVENVEIKAFLKKSEEHLDNAEFEQALVYSSLAFQELEKAAYSSLNQGYWDLDEIEDAYQIWPDESRDKAREFTSKLSQILKNISSNVALAKLGVPLEDVLEIKRMCYLVARSESGKIFPPRAASHHARPEKDRIKHINEFVVDASRKV